MYPLSGRINPAMRLRVTDFPEPDWPNSAVMPASFANADLEREGPYFKFDINLDHPTLARRFSARH